MKKTELTFKPLVFEGIRKFVTSPVAASVHKTAPNRVVLRISAEVAKKAGLKSGEPLTPFVDESNRALLLLEGVRPLPAAGRWPICFPARCKSRASPCTNAARGGSWCWCRNCNPDPRTP